ncbi:hypothetical protein [Burkholderia ubonensis]|uniref:hypothetical protein n=1 Tax=Burkholderia ubonensis TaxID=101571 RepID=UPI0012FBBE05|nr:hypothetical protein [Burkholderia ubonensis]
MSLALAGQFGLPLQENLKRWPEAKERKRYWNSYRKQHPPRPSGKSPRLLELPSSLIQ